MDRGDRFYFIGLMVFMREGDRLRVLDGQQRLATAIIAFSAIRAWIGGDGGDTDTAGRIQYDFVGRAEYGERKPEPKLVLNRNNDDRFQKYVVHASLLAELRSEMRRTNKNDPNYQLLDAIQYIHDRIGKEAQRINSGEQTAAYLAKFIKFLRDSVMVVRLTVPNESNAFRVFETLNDRGMDLSAIDLLKNYLFGLAFDESPDCLRQMEHRWSQLTGTLSEYRQEDFLKVYWTSRHGRTQLDDIFEDVKNSHKTSAEAVDLSMDLLEGAEHYVALGSNSDPTWMPYPAAVRDLIRDLDIIGSKQVRPVILAAIKKFDVGDMERLLRLLEAVSVRWQLIGEERTGALEIQSARLAALIWKGDVKNGSDAFREIQGLYLDDKQFREKFAVKDDMPNQKASYLLRKIEEYERNAHSGASAKDLTPHPDLTLEHILPKNPGEEWAAELAADPKFADECALRLGNMCLMPENRNRDAARAPFGTKRPLYAASGLAITKQVAEYDSWNREAIEKRQIWLAARAVTVWRFQ
jgi:Protein of unknown function (DUF1524)/Protein of unknown function DUF262